MLIDPHLERPSARHGKGIKGSYYPLHTGDTISYTLATVNMEVIGTHTDRSKF